MDNESTNKNVAIVVIAITFLILSFVGGMYAKDILYKTIDRNEKKQGEVKEDIVEKTKDNKIQPIEEAETAIKRGAAAAKEDKELKLESMLRYALEDELLARNEYTAIMEEFGEIKPFSNIKKAEDTHIGLLLPLFEKYNIEVVEINESKPYEGTLQEAFETGVKAEIENIAMYERFLQEDLNSDVKSVFERLKAASEKHLDAFQNGANRVTGRNRK